MLELIVFNVPGRIRKFDHIVGIATPEARVYASAESEKPVNVGGIELEEAGDIAVGNAVGTLQTKSKHSSFPYKGDHIAYSGYKNQGKDRKEAQTQCKLSLLRQNLLPQQPVRLHDYVHS